jgi:hypothetical protein
MFHSSNMGFYAGRHVTSNKSHQAQHVNHSHPILSEPNPLQIFVRSSICHICVIIMTSLSVLSQVTQFKTDRKKTHTIMTLRKHVLHGPYRGFKLRQLL